MNYIKNIIGLTGYYCSGKSSVEKILKENHDFFIIDVDKIGHKALETEKEKIVLIFGQSILKNRIIDRKALSKIVFNDNKKLEKLNSIVHPVMIKEIEKTIKDSKEKNICINAALLFQMKLDKICSYTIFVKSNLLKTIKRAVKRDKRGIKEILNIIKNQKKYAFSKKILDNADIEYINNNKDLNHLKNKILIILKKRIDNYER